MKRIRTPLSRKAAKRSRRARVYLRRTGSAPRQAWRRPLHRTQRNIDSCLGLVNSALRVIEASGPTAAERPIRTSRQLQRAACLISDAASRLGRAARGLSDMSDSVALAPEYAIEAPAFLVTNILRFVAAAKRLAVVSDLCTGASDWLVDAVTRGYIVPDLAELVPPTSSGHHSSSHRPLAPVSESDVARERPPATGSPPASTPDSRAIRRGGETTLPRSRPSFSAHLLV